MPSPAQYAALECELRKQYLAGFRARALRAAFAPREAYDEQTDLSAIYRRFGMAEPGAYSPAERLRMDDLERLLELPTPDQVRGQALLDDQPRPAPPPTRGRGRRRDRAPARRRRR